MTADPFDTVREETCRYCGAPRREGTGLFMCGEGIAHHVEGGCRHDDTAAWIRACVARAEAAEQHAEEEATIARALATRAEATEARIAELERANAAWGTAAGEFSVRAEAAEQRVAELEAALREIANRTHPATYLGKREDGVEMYGGSDDAARFARAALAPLLTEDSE
jgi:uncharacterized Zn finger protein (UPF0148 family)